MRALPTGRSGLIKSPMTGVAQERFETLLADADQPLGRAPDVARAVATMGTGALPFTTGAAIQVDGGMHIHCY